MPPFFELDIPIGTQPIIETLTTNVSHVCWQRVLLSATMQLNVDYFDNGIGVGGAGTTRYQTGTGLEFGHELCS